VITEFLIHYHQARPHQGLEQRRPDPVLALVPLPLGAKVVRHDRLGGLLHEYPHAKHDDPADRPRASRRTLPRRVTKLLIELTQPV